jgi:hypothetical protein
MPEEAYFDIVAVVNSAWLKSITDPMKLFMVFNLVYFLDIASGKESHYEEYIRAEFSQRNSSYAVN